MPFSGQTEYIDRKNELLKLSLAIATCAQRERFAEAPVVEIRNTCCHLANLADNIIQVSFPRVTSNLKGLVDLSKVKTMGIIFWFSPKLCIKLTRKIV